MMRLISQDKTADIPYTGTSLLIEGDDDGWHIMAHTLTKKSVAMAEYDKVEHAIAELGDVSRSAAKGWKMFYFRGKEHYAAN